NPGPRERESKNESAALPRIWSYRSPQGGGDSLAAGGPRTGCGGGQGQLSQLPRCAPRAGSLPGETTASLLAGNGTGRGSRGSGKRRRRPQEGRLRARFSWARWIRTGVLGVRTPRVAPAFADGLRDRLGVDHHLLHVAARAPRSRPSPTG